MQISIKFAHKDGLNDLFPPVPANKGLPDWYKDAQSYWNEEKKPVVGGIAATIKRCMPVLDILSSGYLLRTNQDLFVEQRENGPYFHWMENKENPKQVISQHDPFQVQNHPLNQFGYQLKLDNDWIVTTPKGYSCLFIPPVHRENIINILPAVVDTDSYYQSVSFPFNLNNKDFEGFIKAGTPIAQVIPFKRESYKMDIVELDVKRKKSNDGKSFSKIFDAYRNWFWHRKEYQ